MRDLERIKNRIDIRLNDCLCEMKPGYDDSMVGFNEAWDIVRAVFKEELERVSPCNCGAAKGGLWAGVHEANCASVSHEQRGTD